MKKIKSTEFLMPKSSIYTPSYIAMMEREMDCVTKLVAEFHMARIEWNCKGFLGYKK